ncbi:hypothetical protein CKO51_22725 [Rhodopirellula sp. SM50]|nr:hypothetical protein CKO51_22725 [Rhodopirellula sp. SM50]
MPSEIGMPHTPWNSHSPSCPATIIRDWEIDDLLTVSWDLRGFYSADNLKKLLDVFCDSHQRECVELSLSCDWRERGRLTLGHALSSFHEQNHLDGYDVIIDPDVEQDN